MREFRVSIASFRFHRHSFAYSCRYSPRRKDYSCILSRKITRESIIISAMYRPEYRQVHRRTSINRRAEGCEEKAEWIRSMGISQENCSECLTMTAATVEGRKENKRKAERREQERRYSGKRSAIYGHPSTSRVIATARNSARYSGRPRGCSCTATVCGILVPGDPFPFPLCPCCPLLPSVPIFLPRPSPILTTAVKFIAAVRQEVSESSCSCAFFLSLFLFPSTLHSCFSFLISFLRNASPFPRDEWRFLSEEGTRRGHKERR